MAEEGAPATIGGATSSAIRLVGRFDPPARFGWSGSSFEARFTSSSSVAMRLRAAPLEPHVVMVDGKAVTKTETTTAYAVRVDDRPPVTIEVSADRERYELASGLDRATPHLVVVTREAEAFAGVHELLGVELAPGGKFLPPKPRPRRIEIVGDSISCGYGILGENERCPFTYATERASLTYGARLGRALDADVSTICWSGRGVVRNYDGSTKGTMPELFEATLPGPPATPWAFKAPPPDAVIVNLGTNDFLGGAGQPLDIGAFEYGYLQFVRRLRDLYPAAYIFVTTSPMLKEKAQESANGILARVARRRTSDGDNRIELVVLDSDAAHWGCDSHPDVEMNARIATRLEAAIRARIAK